MIKRIISYSLIALLASFNLFYTASADVENLVKVPNKSTYNSDTFINTNNSKLVGNFHAGHINYVNKTTGDFEPINETLNFNNDKNCWEFTTHSFNPCIPHYADEWIEFQDNFQDKNQKIKFRPIANHIQGQLVSSIAGLTDINAIQYLNAFGEGMDLIVYFTRSQLVKAVRISEAVAHSATADLKFKFELDVPVGKKVYRSEREFTEKGKFLEKLEHKTNGKTDSYELNLNQNKLLNSNKITLIGTQGTDTDKEWFTYLKDFKAWDSGTTPETKHAQSIDVNYTKEGNNYFLEKVVPSAFLNNSVGDVFTDTTTSYYAGAGDGIVRNNLTSTSWATVHNAVTGNSFDYTSATSEIRAVIYGGTGFSVHRLFSPVDTSGLGSTATVSDATFIYTTESAGAANSSSVLVQTSQASNTELANADYDALTFTAGSNIIVNNTGATVQNLTLNATGLTWINKTGFTKLGIAHHAYDFLNVQPGSGEHSFTLYNSEQTGTSSDPYISITYTSATGTTFNTSKINNVNISTVSRFNGIDISGITKINGVAK
jgi:hypothetical protein